MGSGESYGRSNEELQGLPLVFAPGSLVGKVAVISGAGSGIGRATAHFFARLGADLMLCGRTADKLEETKAALSHYGVSLATHALSIRDPEAVDDLFRQAWSVYGGVDILVNNAGGQYPQAAIDFSVKGWKAVVDTNLNGSWYMMQAAARRWRDASVPGSIINVVAAISRGMPGIAHTCAARAGVVYLSKTVAVEWAPLGIRVNCVAPGVISSEGMNVYPVEASRHFPDSNPMRRMGQVEDVANAICYLASTAANFITGEVLTIDGGNQLWGDLWTIPKPDWFKAGEE